MFFLREMQHLMELEPGMFTSNVEDQLRRRLHEEVEGKYESRFGYIVSVVRILAIGAGLVLPGMGSAQYSIRYMAILFQPFKDEVVDGLVTKFNPQGFIVEVGPMDVFVSHRLVPAEFKYNVAGPTPCLENGTDRIESGSRVRIKIMSTQTSADRAIGIGTLKGDSLGLI
ncbi:DNA-directed RNA polymerase II subunit [Blastocladiella emersonii ATCC 22665]|nr:DNA-directed RNA polymerase II subunit [Blastocladiella emersonii ATCC 22665]